MNPPAIQPPVLRDGARPGDSGHVRRIVVSTGFFNPEEVEVAVELIDDRLARGEKSDYHFIFAEQEGRPVGYVCFGPIAGTASSYDLYWIAVDAAARGGGIGRRLMDAAEARIAETGGRRVYVETSSRDQYIPTRAFYDKCGYRTEAVIADFYDEGDGKVIAVKLVGPGAAAGNRAAHAGE
jgi:ribosomal protein S18 acetylase RimI-like enzyme